MDGAIPKKRMIFDDGEYDAPEVETEARERLAALAECRPEDVPDDAVQRDIAESRREDWDKRISELDTDCWNSLVARCSSDRWNGTSYGYAFADSPSDLLRGKGSEDVFKDCESFSIWDENGTLFVSGIHHDGRAIAEVHWLTDAGQELLEEHVFESHYVDDDSVLGDIFNNDEFSREPNFAAEVRGDPVEEWDVSPEQAQAQARLPVKKQKHVMKSWGKPPRRDSGSTADPRSDQKMASESAKAQARNEPMRMQEQSRGRQ